MNHTASNPLVSGMASLAAVFLLSGAVLMSCVSAPLSLVVIHDEPAKQAMPIASRLVVLPSLLTEKRKNYSSPGYEQAVARLKGKRDWGSLEKAGIVRKMEKTLKDIFSENGTYAVEPAFENRGGLDQSAMDAWNEGSLAVVGDITGFEWRLADESYQSQNQGMVQSYRLYLDIAVQYRVFDPASGKVLVDLQFKEGIQETGDNWDKTRASLPSVATTYFVRTARALEAMIARHKVGVSRQLLHTVLKGEWAAKERSLILKKQYKEAMDFLADYYAESRVFEAGYDLAIMKEYFGDWTGAVALLAELDASGGRAEVKKELEFIFATYPDLAK